MLRTTGTKHLPSVRRTGKEISRLCRGLATKSELLRLRRRYYSPSPSASKRQDPTIYAGTNGAWVTAVYIRCGAHATMGLERLKRSRHADFRIPVPSPAAKFRPSLPGRAPLPWSRCARTAKAETWLGECPRSPWLRTPSRSTSNIPGVQARRHWNTIATRVTSAAMLRRATIAMDWTCLRRCAKPSTPLGKASFLKVWTHDGPGGPLRCLPYLAGPLLVHGG